MIHIPSGMNAEDRQQMTEEDMEFKGFTSEPHPNKKWADKGIVLWNVDHTGHEKTNKLATDIHEVVGTTTLNQKQAVELAEHANAVGDGTVIGLAMVKEEFPEYRHVQELVTALNSGLKVLASNLVILKPYIVKVKGDDEVKAKELQVTFNEASDKETEIMDYVVVAKKKVKGDVEGCKDAMTNGARLKTQLIMTVDTLKPLVKAAKDKA